MPSCTQRDDMRLAGQQLASGLGHRYPTGLGTKPLQTFSEGMFTWGMQRTARDAAGPRLIYSSPPAAGLSGLMP